MMPYSSLVRYMRDLETYQKRRKDPLNRVKIPYFNKVSKRHARNLSV